MRIFAVILARGGSRSVPRKNLALIDGEPLVVRAVNQAFRVAAIDEVIVSTDDDEIIQLFGGSRVLSVRRPAGLSTDDARSAPAAIHALAATDAGSDDIVVLLQPTSPLRSDEDIARTLAGLQGFRSSVAVCEAAPHPFKTLIATPKGYGPTRQLADLEAPRQELPLALHPNGAVYAVEVGDLVAHNSFLVEPINPVLMPTNRSIDIDGPEDLALVRYLVERASDTIG
jgi:N-acylneuraminate cytidylyltransferase